MELKDTLKIQMIKVGIRNADLPVGNEKDLVINWTSKHFGYLTPAQIDEAFDLAIKGTTGVDPKCYGLFSCEYVGRILSAYIAYKKGSGEIESSYDKERKHRDTNFHWTELKPETVALGELVKQQLEQKIKSKSNGRH